ncbi:GNAT family N-acetyltransferase [Inquilinus sp.]|jgi:ribosomal protein S18 acetylase RimI-like enzyme|uniref:GNAT family N-acetyltransferase n=1 Tax=Inquilinus sp. TaxID=1932117 RepID=UPI003785203F
MIRRAGVADAAAIAAIHVQAWQESYRGLIPDDYLNRLGVRERTRSHARWLEKEGRGASFVAVDGRRPVGFVQCGPGRGAPHPGWGEVYALYLLEEAKGLGHGRALMVAAADHLAEQGWMPFMLWVLTANFRAFGFYRHLGGAVFAEKMERFGGSTLAESGFRFDGRIPGALES